MKTAIVTGASEGLGRVFAQHLATRGYRTLCIARNEERLQSLMAELGNGHRYHVADLGDSQDVDGCARLIQEQRIHLLVNNAGISQFGVYREAELANEEKILGVNCRAVMSLSHAFLRQAESGDALINLSSIASNMTTPIQPAYCATKAFIASFSESLWYQERARGVYVQALLPGITRTRFIERSSDIEGWPKRFLDIISHPPEAVVARSLKAMDRRRKPIVVPGLSNQLILLLLRFLPRKAIAFSLGKAGELT